MNDPENAHADVTALHHAAAGGRIEVVRKLLESGADINAVEESHGLTPLGFASVLPMQQKEMADFLIARGAEVNIFSAAALGLHEKVESLLKNDSSLVRRRLAPCDWSMQPLHLAAWKGHAKVAMCLLRHGADPAATDEIGTPAKRARDAGHDELADLLESQSRKEPKRKEPKQ